MWHEFMEWTDRTFIPLWCVLVVITAYFLCAFWRDMRILRNTQRDMDERPPEQRGT